MAYLEPPTTDSSLGPWDLGAERARAGRNLPSEAALLRDWGLSRLEVGLLTLGYLEEKCGSYPPGTRKMIERAYALAAISPVGAP